MEKNDHGGTGEKEGMEKNKHGGTEYTEVHRVTFFSVNLCVLCASVVNP